MQVGAMALGGVTLSEVLAARAASGNRSKRTSVIMLYQHGGASQLETYDLKPDAPTATRSQFAPIATNVPGMDICEHFPLQAKIADKFSIVRSLHHNMSCLLYTYDAADQGLGVHHVGRRSINANNRTH